MKKIIVMTLVILFLFGSLAFASGGKNQGDVGTGSTWTIWDPMPFPWPGIEW
ncbi:MAG: hypothetical protein KQI62_05640 [Deltaproteobacteria bacterium]|nr:hypothetical protein [Deltaproteobacteria bacterium]